MNAAGPGAHSFISFNANTPCTTKENIFLWLVKQGVSQLHTGSKNEEAGGDPKGFLTSPKTEVSTSLRFPEIQEWRILH
eukprot:scaffold96234_cov13-Tisochrysis_lutea.AAC.2